MAEDNRPTLTAVRAILGDNATLIPFLLVGSGATSAFQIIMARSLTPIEYAEAFAVLGALSLLVTPAQVVQTLVAQQTAKLIALEQLSALRVSIRTTMRWIGLLAVAVTVATCAATPLLQSVLQLDSPWPVIVAGAGAGILLFEPVVRGLTQGARDFSGLGYTLAAHGLGRLAVGAIAVFSGGGSTGALLASPASGLGGIAAGWIRTRNILRHEAASSAENIAPFSIHNHLRIAIILFSLAGLLHLDVLVVKAFFYSHVTAEYAALALVGRIVFWSGTAVGAVLLPYVVWCTTTGRDVTRAYLASLGLMAVVAGSTAITILIWPNFVYGLIFGNRYPPYFELLPLYVAAASLLAIAMVTANLHIGAGHLRVWRGLALVVAGSVVGYTFAHETPRHVLLVLLTGTAVAVIYLLAEAFVLARRRTPQTR